MTLLLLSVSEAIRCLCCSLVLIFFLGISRSSKVSWRTRAVSHVHCLPVEWIRVRNVVGNFELWKILCVILFYHFDLIHLLSPSQITETDKVERNNLSDIPYEILIFKEYETQSLCNRFNSVDCLIRNVSGSNLDYPLWLRFPWFPLPTRKFWNSAVNRP
jgi:hypothetical protein